MGLRARREQEKEYMKDLISEAAIKIIITEGYDKLSIRKIADVINYSPTTIYIYYKDKAKIVEDISKQLYLKIVDNVKKDLEQNKHLPMDEQIESTFKVFINSITSNTEMGKAIIRSGTKAVFGPSELEDSDENGTVLLQNLLLAGQQQAILRRLDDNVAWMIITALLGFCMNAIENKLYLNPNWPELVGEYTRILINGLLARGDD